MNILIPVSKMMSWKNLAISAFNIAFEKEGVFHLWGHSWEIEKYGMRDELEGVLKYISHRKDCIYLSNGELVKTPKQ